MTITGDQLARIALDAGKTVMEVYATDFNVDRKDDASPVTQADEKAEALILKGLAEAEPGLDVIAEESVSAGYIPEHGVRFALVDPLDGTKEFIQKRGDFTVNIGLVAEGGPVLGVVHTPVDGMLWAGAVGDGAWEEDGSGVRRPIAVRKADPAALTVVASKSHRNPELERFIASLPVRESVSRGSALKFCLVARGEADIYPRTGPTMEWDTAAGHAVLLAAGGSLTTFDGAPFRYGKPEFRNGFFIARGG